MTATSERSALPIAGQPWPIRFIRFLLVVLWGMIAGVAGNFFESLAQLYHDDKLYVDLGSIHVFVFGIVGFACILAGSLWLLDKLIEFNREKVTYVAAFIIAALISGYLTP